MTNPRFGLSVAARLKKIALFMQFHGPDPEKVTVFNLQTSCSCSFLVLYVNASTGTLLRQLRHQLQSVEATDACSKEIDVKQSYSYSCWDS